MEKSKLILQKCCLCGVEKRRNMYKFKGKTYCYKCYTFTKKENMLKESMKIKKIDNSTQVVIDNCKLLGTCGILETHHDVFKDDPERLTTDFMVKMICGDDKVEKYREKSDKNNAIRAINLLFDD